MTFDIRKCSYYKALQSKFSLCFEKTSSCWIYTRSKNRNGYGQFYISGKNYEAHKMSYMIFNGPIPWDKIVRHTCDNRACVNPKHLILGTKSDNSIDMVKRNRQGNQILNEGNVRVIKWLLKYKPKKGLASKLARLYNVDRHTINDIKAQRTWHWVKI